MVVSVCSYVVPWFVVLRDCVREVEVLRKILELKWCVAVRGMVGGKLASLTKIIFRGVATI
jgi:hypothetical protein